jgi:large-conductance mechanosensitive channel
MNIVNYIKDYIAIWKWNLFHNEQTKRFIISNGIVGTTIGVIVAYSAWDLIQSVVGDVILPGIFFIFIFPFIGNGYVSNIFAPIQKLDLQKFVQKLLSFLIVVVLVIFIVDFIVKNFAEFSAPATPPPSSQSTPTQSIPTQSSPIQYPQVQTQAQIIFPSPIANNNEMPATSYTSYKFSQFKP